MKLNHYSVIGYFSMWVFDLVRVTKNLSQAIDAQSLTEYSYFIIAITLKCV